MSTPSPRPSDSFEYLSVVIEFAPADDHLSEYAAYELHAEPPRAQHVLPAARVAQQMAAVRVDFEPLEEEFFAAGDALAHEPEPVGESFDEEAATPTVKVASARAMWRGVPST